MPKYRLELEGDFEKGDCLSCPLLSQDNGYGVECYRAFEDCPLEEVKQGEWVGTIDDVVCSLCGESANLDADEYFIRDKVRFNESNLCPNCGADMRGGKE